jgi:hypothetical protein
MQEPDNVDYWRSFFEDYAVKITQHLLQFTTQISLKVAANGCYMQHDSGLVSEPISMTSKFPVRINRHANFARKIQNQFLAVHDPNEFYERLQEEGFGSKIGLLETYNTFSMAFEFPYEYNVKSPGILPHAQLCSHQLPPVHTAKQRLLLHFALDLCWQGKASRGKSLNKNKGYMEAFNQWFTEHNLGRFFADGYFCLDNIEILEKELQCSVNLYTFEGELQSFSTAQVTATMATFST